ncbi:hypothetical protein NL394_14480 [Paenarthrobacter ureafaciens]|uniref:Uncharacterized protein n=1 Tax=Paenarthrobacter ureafaciens TaxID=37931 RepID=A0AAX3EEA2_PAEUR|nr:hypothetical protein [Paenarthrobacter ureafaciens]UYV96266.1 hypothetical protein NL394_14480 [Paenarthrobacter ureafaciens]
MKPSDSEVIEAFAEFLVSNYCESLDALADVSAVHEDFKLQALLSLQDALKETK